MKLHDVNGKLSFGWTSKTHSLLTRMALKKIPQLEEFTPILQKASVMPDFILRYTGIFNNSHKYFGQQLSLSGERPKNAFEMYNFFLSDAIKYLADGNDVAGMQNAGMALHFLQDVASPFHTDRNATGFFSILPHRRYEILAKNSPRIISMAAENPIDAKQNFYDIFMHTYKDKGPEELAVSAAGIRDKLTLESSIKHTLSSAYTATEKFLKRLANLDSLPDVQKSRFLKLDADEFMRG